MVAPAAAWLVEAAPSAGRGAAAAQKVPGHPLAEAHACRKLPRTRVAGEQPQAGRTRLRPAASAGSGGTE